MEEFHIKTEGNIFVEAENPEEAKEKSKDMHREHEILTREAEPIHREEDIFKIKISEVGSNKASRGYKTQEHKSALRLAFKAVLQIADSMVGEKYSAAFKYDLACLLLSDIEGDKVTGEKIMETRQEFQDEAREQSGFQALDDYWTIEEDSSDKTGKGENQW